MFSSTIAIHLKRGILGTGKSQKSFLVTRNFLKSSVLEGTSSNSIRHLGTHHCIKTSTLTTTSPALLYPLFPVLTQERLKWQINLQQKHHLSNAPFRRRNNKEKKPLMNEGLVKFLKRKSGSDEMEVRVVTDLGRDKPSEVSVLPLVLALDHAKNLNIDLIEINLKQTPPVLKATDYGKLAYDMRKKQKAVQQSGGGSKQLVTKEYKFKAGISEHDLERKVQNLKSYLVKGHPCKVTITARAFLVRQNNNITIETLERVQELLSDDIMEPGKVRRSNPKHLSMLLQPKRQQ